MTQFGFPPSGNMVNFQPPTYNPLAGPGFMSNPMFQMAMAMYLPQAMGQGNFLPSLMPSQHLFDQFTAAKYQNARMQGMTGAQALDQQTLTTNILGIRNSMSDTPATAMNVEQASNIASIINHPLAKMFIGQMMGPENMEDLFYGRRGSADMLYQSVAKSGFHRRDPTGGERMSAESLSGMTREMYAQMYGPDADLSEMNGISAGRAGVLYDDLFRRGVLPQSIGNLKPSERVKAISESLPTDDKTMERLSREYAHEQLLRSDAKILDDKRYAELTPQQQRAEVDRRAGTARAELEGQFQDIKDYNAGTGKKSIGEIEQMDGFGIAARSIDAQKVTSTLKGYSGAIAAVREIFGDNGNPNAPMQQLITALEALTQNQIGRVSPKKIEQYVREVQLASRSAGMGLGAVAAIGSQAAAFGDQLGLDRSFANSSTLAGIRQGDAMRQTGAFTGFGAMTQEEASLKGAYLESAAAASPVGNMIGVAVRTVKEDPSKHYDKDGKALTPVGAMVQALERGETTYTDPTTGKKVDIQQGLANDQSAFVRDVLDKTEDAAITEERMMDRQGNQEYTSQIKGLSRLAQRADIIGDMGATFAGQLSLDSPSLSADDRQKMGQAAAAAVLSTNSRVAPEKRIAHMQEKIKQNLITAEESRLEQAEPGLTPEQRRAKAEATATRKFESAYGSKPTEVNESMQRLLAQGNRMLTAVGREANMTVYNLKDFFGADVQETNARLQAQQERRAELMGDFGDTQSTMLQRFADVLGGLGSGNKTTMGQAVQAMLGIIPNSQISDAMRPGVGALFELAGQEYRRGIVTNEEELISLRQTAQGSDPKAAAEAKEKLRAFAGEKGKGVEDVEKLFEAAAHNSANKKVAGGERNIGLSRDIVRGLELGGSAGVSRASGALAQSLLGKDASKDSVNALAEALRSGDEKKLTSLLPASITGDQSDAGKQRMQQIIAASGALKQLDESGRGLGEADSKSISDARLRTVRDIVESDKTGGLSKTEEGRRLIAMSKADAQGDYTFNDKKYNAHTDLGGGEKEDTEKFKRDIEVAAASADQKTKDKVDEVLKQGAADPAQQMAAVGQQVMEGLSAAMGGGIGGISSANITIQNLETLSIQNATGLKLPEGTTGKVTGSAAVDPARTPSSVGAAVDAQTEKKRADAVSAHDAAMKDLGRVAHDAGVPMQDLISGKAQVPDALKERAAEAVAKANETAKTVNELHGDKKQVDAQKDTPKDQKYDIDPKEFTQSVSQADGGYAAIQSGAFRDKNGKPIDKPTDAEFFDAIHTVERQKDDPKHRTGRIGQIGDKYYEEYLVDGVAPAYREVTVGPKKRTAASAQDSADIAAAERRKKYDYDRLGVTPAVTPQQKAIIDSAVTDPTGTMFGVKMTLGGKQAKDAMFTLPDDAAVDLFSKFNPEAQKKGLEELKRAKEDKKLTPEQRENAARLYDAISASIEDPAQKDTAKKEVAVAPPSAQRSVQEEIEKAAQVSQQREQEQSRVANEARKQTKEVVQTEQTADQKKLSDLDSTMRQSWTQLTESQKAEVIYLRRKEEYAKATAVLADPKASDEEKEKARNFVLVTNSLHKGNSEKETIIAKQMAEEAGIDISREFKKEQTLGSLTVNGRKLDHREHYRRSRAYDSDDASTGVSDAALVHMDRIRQTEEQEEFVKSQDHKTVEGKQDQKQTEEKQQQADKRAETKQRDVALSVPTVEERKTHQAEVEIFEVAKHVATAEAQSGALYAANNGGHSNPASGGEQEITGTLQLRGLTEVLLNARSRQMELPPENGPPVDPAQGQGGYVTAMA